jgi:hypothetical protein
MKWEYKFYDDPSMDVIRDLGWQGWELIQVIRSHAGPYAYIFKRPLKEEKQWY